MRYQESIYAKALLRALEEKDESEIKKILKNFMAILLKNNDFSHLNSILGKVEKLYLTEEGVEKIYVESASPLSKNLREEIESALGKKVLINEKVRPGLLAGVRIILNEEILIDATAAQRLAKIFH
ncbi:MAG TPA: F0F1 ATP synthase subunit delta [Candidatus Paceibacterota bacterium]